MPSLNVVPGLPPAPTVPQLQNHIACVLARAMDDHLGPAYANDPAKEAMSDYVLWHHLVDYNFLGTINLTLFVTQSQGLNPSFNFITPLTNLGKPIEQVIESSNGITSPSNVTMNTNNFTLAVGFQLNGTQDHNFVLNYVVDMHRLYAQMYDMKEGKAVIRDGGLLQTCAGNDKIESAKGTCLRFEGRACAQGDARDGAPGIAAHKLRAGDRRQRRQVGAANTISVADSRNDGILFKNRFHIDLGHQRRTRMESAQVQGTRGRNGSGRAAS